mgnify:CR=1 FL=1
MTTKPTEEYMGISRKAVEQADLASLLISMLARINQLEEDIKALRHLVLPPLPGPRQTEEP